MAREAESAAGARADAETARAEAEAAALAAERAEKAAAEAKASADKARVASEVAASRAAAPVAAMAQPNPERELERIAELRRLGRDEEADKALAEFRRHYPGYQISREMREKVERKAVPAR
jgi:hypothetical protein